MDESTTRSHIESHADAVVRGDMDAVIADFSEDLRPQVPQLARRFPSRLRPRRYRASTSAMTKASRRSSIPARALPSPFERGGAMRRDGQ